MQLDMLCCSYRLHLANAKICCIDINCLMGYVFFIYVVINIVKEDTNFVIIVLIDV